MYGDPRGSYLSEGGNTTSLLGMIVSDLSTHYFYARKRTLHNGSRNGWQKSNNALEEVQHIYESTTGRNWSMTKLRNFVRRKELPLKPLPHTPLPKTALPSDTIAL